MGDPLEFRVLGPFEVVRDGCLVGPAGSKRRGVLAMLVLRANHAVPAGDLIDGLWAGDPPPSAANVVQTYVSAWRKAVEPDRASRGGGTRLATVGPAYRLRIERGELDLDLFTQAVAEGAAAAARGDHEVAAARLSAALGLWRGAPRWQIWPGFRFMLRPRPGWQSYASRLLRRGRLPRWPAGTRSTC